MRVLVMAHQWLPRHCAGAEVMLHSMLRALAGRGHTVDVTLSREDGPPATLDGVALWPGRRPQELIGSADVLVTHLENTPAASMLGRWNGVPVVQVLHNTMDVTREWIATGTPSLVVTNSEWMLADYQASLGEAMPPALICRPPVHAADYRTMPGDMVTLINLRRMETSPGGSRMGKGSEVFWALARRMPDVKFLGVTGAYGAQDIRWLPNVEILEHVPHHRMRDEVYGHTRVLLMPSSYESWGRTAVEAMSSGIPVVAHPTPGLTEALGGAGVLNDRDDLDAWETAVRRLLDPGAWEMASRAAYARALALDPTEDLNRWCDAVEALAS